MFTAPVFLREPIFYRYHHISAIVAHLHLKPCIRVFKLAIPTTLDMGHHLNGFSVFIDFHRYHK
jgi:hypothetical protein